MATASTQPRVTLLTIMMAMVLPSATAFTPNYDESKVPDYTLPDSLVVAGKEATDSAAWEKEVRPATLALFQRDMFGRVPVPTQPLNPSVSLESEVADACGGKAVRREYLLRFSHRNSPSIRLLVYLPKGQDKVPAFMGLNFRGNQIVEDDPRIALETGFVLGGKKTGDNTAFAEKNRGTGKERWPVDTIVGRGYALVTACCGNIDPDYDDGFENGVHAMFPKPKAEGWGTISAWAWGLSQMLTAVGEEIAEIDAARVAVIGHSRLGKTALWAGATDPRFAIAISNNSGCGGAALSRRAFGETVARINNSFPHWFNANFKNYNGNEAALPVDQHQLVALIAPRPVYVASATGDQWADPRGEFLSLLNAVPVYQLYDDQPFGGVTTMPAPGKSVGHRMGYHLREGKHNITPEDWAHYLDFADRWLKK
ncbi:acetylxylan esterase [Haloferula sp. A504]|uniref:glucuronyl esterase domain-containing protein n=1 Tax=Haloferula sp. A504 TaxID=3373601 RepID=UPI0031CA3340|nr:acetylxylan esterase [Verrucomicrobiaceae bacterium E54]